MQLRNCGFSLSAIVATSFMFSACSESNPNTPFASTAETNSSSESLPISSSDFLSSSEIPSSSSSSVQSPAAQAKFQTWHGTDKAKQIKTGYDAGAGTSGYWYEVNDNSEGGQSKINAQGERIAVDATDMGGICITYTSDNPPMLELVLDDKQDSLFAIATPNVSLSKTTTANAFNFKWSDFKMPSWATKYNNISGEEAAKQLVGIRFKVQAAPGTSNFDIIEVGSYGNCTYPPPQIEDPKPYIDTNPNSDPNPNLSKTSPFETWYGSLGEYSINTGYDNGTKTSGFWFTYGDDEIGGASNIIWPIDVCYEYEPGCFDVVFDYCEGICGTADFSKGNMTERNPFVGLGFNIAGEKSQTDNTLVSADASAMGGVCVTYTSDNDINLRLGLGNKEEEYDYNIPTKKLPKSADIITKYVAWADFKQPNEGNGKKISGEEAAKILTMIKFEIEGNHGQQVEFNIKSVGPYNGGNCHP